MSPISAAGRHTAATGRGVGAAKGKRRSPFSLVDVALCCYFCCFLTLPITPLSLFFVQSVAAEEAPATTPPNVAAAAQALVDAADAPPVAAAAQALVDAADAPPVAAAAQTLVDVAEDEASKAVVGASTSDGKKAPKRQTIWVLRRRHQQARQLEKAIVEAAEQKGEMERKAAEMERKVAEMEEKAAEMEEKTIEMERKAAEIELQLLDVIHEQNASKNGDGDSLVDDDIEEGEEKKTSVEFPITKVYKGTKSSPHPDGNQLATELGYWETQYLNDQVNKASSGLLPHYNLTSDKHLTSGESFVLRKAVAARKKHEAFKWATIGTVASGVPLFGGAWWNAVANKKATAKSGGAMILGGLLFLTGLSALLPNALMKRNEAKSLYQHVATSIANRFKQEEYMEKGRRQKLED